jgi:hypothetical protein
LPEGARTVGLEQDLRATSDLMLNTLSELERLENEKRNERPGSDRFRSLAAEIERLASVVFAQTHNQRRLADLTQHVVQRTGESIATIEEMLPARDVRVILNEWRAAERRAAESPPETAEHSEAVADSRRLRDEYQRAHDNPLRRDDGTAH